MNYLFLTIGWIIVIAFGITFIVTILAMLGWLTIGESYLKVLFTKVILEIIAAALFIFHQGANTQIVSPYAGHWAAEIHWTTAWSNKLFNFQGTESFSAVNPRSEGSMSISVSGRGVYEGVSLWELKNGSDVYSRLAVNLRNFDFDKSGKLKKVEMGTAVREQMRNFSYAPYRLYYMEFDEVTENKMRGRMMTTDDSGNPLQVGTVVLERQ